MKASTAGERNRMCKNTTCSRVSASTYCSPRCQAAMINVGHLVGLPDIRVGMDTERAIVARAEELGVPVRRLLLMVIEREFGDVL